MPYPDDLLKAEDKAAKKLSDAYIESVDGTKNDTDWQQIADALVGMPAAEAVVSLIAVQPYDPSTTLRDLLTVSIEISGKEISRSTGLQIGFDLVDPNAIKWIEEYGAQDVKYISEASKDALRDIILKGYQDGITPRNQAHQIREHIGLDPQRSQTLRKYGENLLVKGKSEDDVWRLMEKKGKALLNDRAMIIAVNEATEAACRGFYETTKDAVTRGILNPKKYEGYRIVTPDERLCTKCSALAGEARDLPDGVYNSSGSTIPKLHTICRCCEGVREITMKKKETRQAVRSTTDIIFEAKGLKETDEAVLSPTVPLVEGVFSGRGFPVLRLYEEFSKDVRWLNGLTVVTNHEPLDPNARRIGQLADPSNDEAAKRTKAITQFWKIDLTQRELEKIRRKEPLHGSMSFACNLEMTSGDYQGVHFEATERGPYVFYEYSLVNEGVVTPADGAGFNMECKGCKNPNHNHNSQSSAPGGADMETDEMKKMIGEAVEPLKGQIATLEQKNTVLEGELKTVKEHAEAEKKSQVFEAFQSKLKPAYEGKAQELFEAYQKDPAGWTIENADKFVQKVQEKKLAGSAIMGGAAGTPETLEEANKAHQEKMAKINEEAV